MGSYRQLTGMQTPPRRPDRVKPVPEHYDGENFPYRGTQTHGVQPPSDVDPGEYYENSAQDDGTELEDIPYVAPEEEPEPVPVRIVQKTARERLDWRAVRYSVTDQAQQILGRHEKRKSVRIRVHGDTDAIYIGNDSGLRTYTGYMVPAGTELFPISSTEDVWAIADSGKTVEISIMYEFGVEL